MNEQLEKINEQAQLLITEIEKYKSAASINRQSAESFQVVADALKTVSSKIKPLTGNGFLRLQYITMGLVALNIVLAGALIYFLVIK
jgi:hypothetical protein